MESAITKNEYERLMLESDLQLQIDRLIELHDSTMLPPLDREVLENEPIETIEIRGHAWRRMTSLISETIDLLERIKTDATFGS